MRTAVRTVPIIKPASWPDHLASAGDAFLAVEGKITVSAQRLLLPC